MASVVMPLGVVRRATVSHVGLTKLAFGQTVDLIDRCIEAEFMCRHAADPLCVALAKAIHGAEEMKPRAELLRLRRTIYNDRQPTVDISLEGQQALRCALSATDLELLDHWLDTRRLRTTIAQDGNQILAQELAAARHRFRRLLCHRQFRKGLALASPTLSDELDLYINTPFEKLKRPLRTELSLLRYYSRSALKLSPFSTFTYSTVLLLAEDGSAPVNGGHTRMRYRPVCCVRPNRALVGTLANYISRHPDIVDYVPVRSNRSVLGSDRYIILLRQEYSAAMPCRTRVPTESLLRFMRSRTLEWLTAYLEKHGGVVRFGDLSAAYSQALGRPDDDRTPLQRLIDLGLLILEIPLAEDPLQALKELANFLRAVPSKTAASLEPVLTRFAGLVCRFEAGGPELRCELLKNMKSLLSEAFITLGITPSPDWFNSIVYEDCVEKQVRSAHLVAPQRAILDDLTEFLARYSALLDFNLTVRETIKDVLRAECGGRVVPFLTFMRLWKETLARGDTRRTPTERFRTPNPRGLEPIAVVARTRAAVFQDLSEPSDDACLDLRLYAQKRRLSNVQRVFVEPRRLCVTCYCQPIETSNGGKGIVINGIADGPARTFLRTSQALTGHDGCGKAIDKLRDVMQSTFDAGTLSEVVATFDYNANLHPRFTQHIIDYEGRMSHSSTALSLDELSIGLDHDGRVSLFESRTGIPVTALTCGMLMTSYAPLTYHLLSSINGFCIISAKPFHPFRWRDRPTDQDIEHYPRLIYGNCVVRRQGWSVLLRTLPVRAPRETDWDYFVRVRAWQHSTGLPEEVFVYADPGSGWQEDGVPGSRRTWNRHKPQYVHFRNYLLLTVFAKIVSEIRHELYVEEALPSSNELAHSRMRRPLEAVIDVCLTPENTTSPSLMTGFQFGDRMHGRSQ